MTKNEFCNKYSWKERRNEFEDNLDILIELILNDFVIFAEEGGCKNRTNDGCIRAYMKGIKRRKE